MIDIIKYPSLIEELRHVPEDAPRGGGSGGGLNYERVVWTLD